MFLIIWQFYAMKMQQIVFISIQSLVTTYSFTHLRAEGENKMCGDNEEESNAEHNITVIWVVPKIH